jgi:hypothetical protein
MPRRPHSEILPSNEKHFRLQLKIMRRQFGHLDEYLPYLEQEVEKVRKLKEAGQDPRGIEEWPELR